ncbi:5-formyltetrahydrofolate cyclo-ligase [Alphaproteobacteria bacterium]|nr:5-formyltetrahydrofolate cyclo-ligase [Alphaproteobacteria bacterium]
MNKKEIRKHHLNIRQEISTINLRDNSKLINEGILNLISTFNSAESIGLFYPYNNEVDVLLMVSELEKRGLACLLPKVIDKQLPLKYFFYSPDTSKLEKGYGGIMEPTGGEERDPDIIITSCSAFNEEGYRVGYGGGFFDRTLNQLKQKKKIISILAAFENQKTSYQFQESFDEKVDYICTENNTYKI